MVAVWLRVIALLYFEPDNMKMRDHL